MANMKNYKYLFFDFDGTICDTYEGIKEILDLTFKHYGEDVPVELYRKYIGPPLSETFTKYWGEEKAYQAVAYFRENYAGKQAIFKTKLYDGIKECFDCCRAMGYRIGVATCKKQEEAERLLDYFGIKNSVDFVSGLCYNVRETKQDVLEYALQELSIGVKDAVMIGDTIYDVDGAKSVGMDCILCLWGFGEYDQIDEPNIIYRAKTPMDVCQFLQGDKE